MEIPVLTKSQLAKLFQDCIWELDQFRYSRSLYTLGTLFESLGKLSENRVYYAVAPFIAMLAHELEESTRILTVPLPVPSEFKDPLTKLRQQSSEAIKDLLGQLKIQFCDRDHPEPESLIRILGEIGKLYSELYEHRRRIEQLILRFPAPRTEELN